MKLYTGDNSQGSLLWHFTENGWILQTVDGKMVEDIDKGIVPDETLLELVKRLYETSPTPSGS